MTDLQWFIDRIGDTVYRDTNGCDCKNCRTILNEGFELINEEHARYMYKVSEDYKAKGVDLNFRDEK